MTDNELALVSAMGMQAAAIERAITVLDDMSKPPPRSPFDPARIQKLVKTLNVVKMAAESAVEALDAREQA